MPSIAGVGVQAAHQREHLVERRRRRPLVQVHAEADVGARRLPCCRRRHARPGSSPTSTSASPGGRPARAVNACDLRVQLCAHRARERRAVETCVRRHVVQAAAFELAVLLAVAEVDHAGRWPASRPVAASWSSRGRKSSRRRRRCRASPRAAAPARVNPRGMSGRRTRMIQTPAHTSMNANSVPMLVISPTMSPGTKAANSAVKTKKSQFDL